MPARTLDRLLQLPPAERAELARTLWESLTEEEQQAHLTAQERSDVARLLAEHLDRMPPLPWHHVRHVLQGGD